MKLPDKIEAKLRETARKHGVPEEYYRNLVITRATIIFDIIKRKREQRLKKVA